jgi:hypothetical protein
MTTLQAVKPELQSASGNGPKTPGIVIIGWLLLCFAIIPLTMAVHGDGRVYTHFALGMLVIGAAFVAIPRLGWPRGTKPGPTASA